MTYASEFLKTFYIEVVDFQLKDSLDNVLC